jgi:hypothetical protein
VLPAGCCIAVLGLVVLVAVRLLRGRVRHLRPGAATRRDMAARLLLLAPADQRRRLTLLTRQLAGAAGHRGGAHELGAPRSTASESDRKNVSLSLEQGAV